MGNKMHAYEIYFVVSVLIPQKIFTCFVLASPHKFNKKAKQRKKYNNKKCWETIEMLLFIRTNSTNYSSLKIFAVNLSLSFSLIPIFLFRIDLIRFLVARHMHTHTQTQRLGEGLIEWICHNFKYQNVVLSRLFSVIVAVAATVAVVVVNFFPFLLVFFNSFSFFGLIVWFALSIFNIKVKEHEQQQHDEHTLSHTQNKLSLFLSLSLRISSSSFLVGSSSVWDQKLFLITHCTFIDMWCMCAYVCRYIPSG